MEEIFFSHNNIHVASISRAGASAIARAAIFSIEPEYKIVSLSGNQENVERALNLTKWQGSMPRTELPESPLIPVRDPIERFRSACAEENKTADEALENLDAGNFSFPFKFTSDYLRDQSKLFKFPEHIDSIAEELGLSEIPVVNDSETSNKSKPDLTPEQLERVQEIYADDIALYNSITEAGQVYIAPLSDAQKAEAKATIATNAAAKQAQPIFVNGFKVLTDLKTQQDLIGIQIALNRRPDLEIDYEVTLETGETIWTKINSSTVGAMIDAIADNRIAIAALQRAKEKAVDEAVAAVELNEELLNF